MATAVQTDPTDLGFEEELIADVAGWRGVKVFLVNSRDAVEMQNASGLPALASAFDTTLTTLVLARRRPVYREGPDGVARAYMLCEYEDQAGQVGGSPNLYNAGARYSDLRGVPGTIGINYSATTDEALPEGTTREYNTNELIVTAYRNSTTHRAHWFEIQNKVNSNSVVIPPRRSGFGGFTALAGQLLARHFTERDVRDGLIEVQYHFGIGDAGWHRTVFKKRDENGLPTGPEIEGERYEEASFTASSLWTP